jgi:transposase-like protein
MSKSVLDADAFHNEPAAYAWVETRVWPDGPICPHCGGMDRIGKLQGKSTRPGVYKCYQCRKPFTVKVGTVFEASHIPLRYWLQAMYLLCSSKKGISANQLHRTLGLTLKSAWFMAHRIREAMKSVGVEPMGGDGGIVEADETFIWRKGEYPKVRGGYSHKMCVMTLVERGGNARSFVIDKVTQKETSMIISANISREAHMMTDTASYYRWAKHDVASHEMVNHFAGEYVRYGENFAIHTNTVESYYSVFKRGMKGVYQHCAEKHLHRYAAEFDFRHNNRIALGVDDVARTEQAVKGIVGKRLTYRTVNQRG